MNNLQQVGLYLVIMFGLSVWNMVFQYRRRGFRGAIYGVKVMLGSFKWLVGLLFSIYIIIGSSVVLPEIVKWSGEQSISSPLGELLINKGAPVVWVLLTLIVCAWILYKSIKPLKLTEKEKVWRIEDKDKFHNGKVYQWFANHVPKMVRGNRDVNKI